MLLLGVACAAPEGSRRTGERTFAVPAARVEAAVRSLLRDHPMLAGAPGLVRTDWRELPADRAGAGGLLGARDWERDRFLVRINSVDPGTTRVDVDVEVERRPTLGAGATRWERAFSDGTREDRFFLDLEAALR